MMQIFMQAELGMGNAKVLEAAVAGLEAEAADC